MKLTFTDTETTGLPKHYPAGDGPEITEYCFATWENGKTSDVEHVLIMPQNPPPPDKEGIHRTPDGFPLSFRADEWKHQGARPWSAEDNKRVFGRMHGAHIGGSNPRFDVERFRFEVDRFSKGGPRFEHHHRVMDLNSIGYPWWVMGLVESTGLVALAKFFGIEHDAHTSNGDVLASIAVFEALLDECRTGRQAVAFARDVVELYAEGEDPSLVAAAKEALK